MSENSKPYFLVDFYNKKTKKFIRREILSQERHGLKTELEVDRYLKDKIQEDQYYVIYAR